jgi:hypothetical protein
MLTIKCAQCKTKLFKYQKLGKGHVLRCHKSRIARKYNFSLDGDRLVCPKCGETVGLDKGGYFGMNKGSFTYTGTKVSKL